MSNIRSITDHFNTTRTTQGQPLAGAKTHQVKNSDGCYVWAVDKWARLGRFLVLGSEGGSYYASERKLTLENALGVLECIKEDGPRVVRTIVEISQGGRAPKNTPTIFVLAMCCKLGDEATKVDAYQAMPKVCRIGTHLFQFCEAIKAFGGFSSGTQRALARWYTERGSANLALQVVKYQQREGWSHRDVLRLAKPRGHERGGELDRILGWATGKWFPGDEAASDGTDLIWAFEEAKALAAMEGTGATNEGTRALVKLITDFRLPRECIPTQYLNKVEVWEALLDNGGRGMPMTAMIRNLPKMTSIGLLVPMSDASKRVVDRLSDEEALKKARVHPLQFLVALKTYQSGRGVRGSLTWSPVSQVVDALDRGFYKTFGNVEPTGLRWCLALDVSASMSWTDIAGLPRITPRVGSAAMVMITAAVEQQHVITAFSHNMVEVKGISPRKRLDDIIRQISQIPMGGTDCSLPMTWALQNKIPVDVFVVYTDSETNQVGRPQPVVELRKYRQKMGIDAKLIVVGMVSNGFTIADPNDSGMIDIVGFDTAAPKIMSDFAQGRI